MISKKEIKHIAKLAKLKLSKNEIDNLNNELCLILDYIEKLKEIDVSQVEPCSHPVEVINVLREDKQGQGSGVRSQKLLDLAPNKQGKYIKVKAVL